MTEQVLDLTTGQPFTPEVQRATDPSMYPTTYTTPGDWAAQFPQPLDSAEILSMCEEITLYKALPEKRTMLYGELWREMSMAFMVSGSGYKDTNYISFADGYCPEEYAHSGSNMSVNHKNIGAKKTLSEREIMHSMAVAALPMGAINTLVGAAPAGEGMPGASDIGTFQRGVIRDLKAKEIQMAEILILNGWDRLLVQGDTATSSLQFDGIEKWATNMGCSMHTNTTASASGTFSATSFDRFLSESCAKPTMLMGHPQAIQELLMSYYSLGFQGSMQTTPQPPERMTPGFNFAGYVNTGVGRLPVIADNNFSRTASGDGLSFQADIWAFRMTHNGEPLVYKSIQVPLSYKELAPLCTAISFEIWAATALIIKSCCFHGKFKSWFTGRVTTTCNLMY